MAESASASGSNDIKVQLYLAGGHTQTLWLKPDDPLLQGLFQAVLNRSQVLASGTWYQVMTDEGRSVLTFPGEHLVGIRTEPPVLIEQAQPQASAAPTAPQAGSAIDESRFLQIDNFLTSEEHRRLIDFTLQHQADFVPASTAVGVNGQRQHLVLHSFPEFSELLTTRVREVLPAVLQRLGLPPFNPTQIETQLAAHNDGNGYPLHNDNSSPDTSRRYLTYVYYFNREPKGFEGGELQLYNSKLENNVYVQADSHKRVEARNNSVVFFLARYLREMQPVRCPSKDFADSCFTINGWLWQ